MDKFFIFCFRSCLKGENDREYYDILEVDDSGASADTIKKQYKKLSLTLHPDKLAQRGVEVTDEHKQRFLKLKEAYDVLSDPKRRKLYDQLGASGLKLLENPTEVDHTELLRNFQKNRGDRTSLLLLIAFIFAAILILPILFSLKCDGTLGSSAPWLAIWTPMWIVDIALLFMAVALFFISDKPEDHEEGQPPVPEEKIPMSLKVLNLLTTSMFVLLQIFIGMKLDGYVSWNWFGVFAPWFFYELFSAFPLVSTLFEAVPEPNYDDIHIEASEEGQSVEDEIFMAKMQKEVAYFEKVIEKSTAKRSLIFSTLRVWQAIFLAVQLNGSVDWNWGLVFLPIWVYLFTHYGFVFHYRQWSSNNLRGVDLSAIAAGVERDPKVIAKVHQAQELASSSCMTCLCLGIPLYIAILLVCRLQVSSYTTFVIILPVFIIIGCACCGIFTFLCCLSNVDTESFQEEIDRHRGGGPASSNSKGEAGYDPPHDVESPGAEYGTFAAPAEQSPILMASGSSITIQQHQQQPAPQGSSTENLLSVSHVDVDID